MKCSFSFLFFLSLSVGAFAQNDSLIYPIEAKKEIKMVVQLSGLVLGGDSLFPVPFTSVYRKRDKRGAVSSLEGFFTLSAFQGDTIVFQSIGFSNSEYVVPFDPEVKRMSIVQVLNSETYDINTVAVYPWPATREKFRDEFLALNLPSNEFTRTKESLDAIAAYDGLIDMEFDGGDAYNVALNKQYQQMYMAGQSPTSGLLNPMAFARFLQALRNGDLKFR